MKLKPLQKNVAESIRERILFKQKTADDLKEFHAKIQIERQKTHQKMIQQTAKNLGIDLNTFAKEGVRRNNAQRRLIDQAYHKIKKQVTEQIKQDTIGKKAFEKKFHESYLKELPQKEGNPCLLFWEPVMDPSEHITQDEPGGMVGYGCRQPQLSSREHDTDVIVASTYGYRNHIFYNRNYVRTGDDDMHVWQRIQQDLIIGRRPIERGRGDFIVDSLQLWLRGVGSCELRRGDIPCGEGVIGPGSEARVEVDIVMAQEYEDSPDGYTYQDIYHNDYYWSRCDDYMGEARVEPCVVSIDPAVIYSPDNGGGEISLFFSLSTFTGAYLEESLAELDFSAPDFEGIHLHDIRLCGDYA